MEHPRAREQDGQNTNPRFDGSVQHWSLGRLCKPGQ